MSLYKMRQHLYTVKPYFSVTINTEASMLTNKENQDEIFSGIITTPTIGISIDCENEFILF